MNRAGPEVGTSPLSSFSLAWQPPFDWARLLAFLSTRAIDGIECCADDRYSRSLRIDLPQLQWRGRISASNDPAGQRLRIRASAAPPAVRAVLAARLRRLFDLDADPLKIAAVLGPLARERPGLRLPGAVDGFEIAVRAVLGQQVSVKAARTLAGRFVMRFGERLDEAPAAGAPSTCSPSHSFPRPQVIAALPRDAVESGARTDAETRAAHPLMSLGLTRQRARTLIALAQALVERRVVLDPDAPDVTDPASTMAALETLPGIGPWTAQYIALRALSWQDALPAADLGVMKALGTRDPREVIQRAEAWRPWRAYAVIHLWTAAAAEAEEATAAAAASPARRRKPAA